MTNSPPLPGERGFGYALVAASALILWLAFGISGLSSASSAGAFPMAAAAVMLVSAIGIVHRNRRRPHSPRPPTTAPRSVRTGTDILPREVALYMAILIAYVVSLEHVGFLASTSVFLLVSLWQLHRRSAVTLLAVAIGVLLTIQMVFGTLFQVQLP
ncbi:hypothetical protein HL658_18015 [Azospirillum sp. RWY-5-1]|uniref:DUF1468 domain-containing protein n=1 Tax=Azospirillum oleiclasticum TaxID=2735135 RepID=A0ABX2TJ51_9PROT|nr:tripartite tricarboxylate transporter TctB family protein [Azospirillum oleiclasticum]NYZ14450.1 hypothetical protein [Azospirillum oleiclasticum]NYZ23198.1 hypothetical protein [Azospirillum oleiclasticum]